MLAFAPVMSSSLLQSMLAILTRSGVHGFHLAHHSTNLFKMGHLQLLKYALGASKHMQLLWCGQQPLQQPAMSPCGAFVCLYASQKGCIKVVDIRSG